MMTEKFLIDNNYKIQNAKITSVDLSMKDHGCLTLQLVLEGSGWGCVYGNVCLGNGFLGAKKFKGWQHCGDYLMMIMDTVGVATFNDMTGKYVRVACDEDDRAKIIGNLIEDKWFTGVSMGDEVQG